jgi:hypothetical protein
MTKLRVITVGDVRGNLDVVTQRITKLNDSGKGPFNVVFCVGEFSGPSGTATPHFQQILNGEVKLAFSLYFILSGTSNDTMFASQHNLATTPSTLAPNVHFLGQSGIADVHGLHVAFLSGYYERVAYRTIAATTTASSTDQNEGTESEVTKDQNASKTEVPEAPFLPFYSKKHVEALLFSDRSSCVDLLLTNEWGDGWDVCLSSTDARPLAHRLSPVVSDIARQIKPRHHLATGSYCFFKLAPYTNVDSVNRKPLHPTRFVALGPVPPSSPSTPATAPTALTATISKVKSPKWMHALSVQPMHTMDSSERHVTLAGATASPYIAALTGSTAASLSSSSTTSFLQRAPPPLLSVPSLLGAVPSRGTNWKCQECGWRNKGKNKVCGGGSASHGCGKPPSSSFTSSAPMPLALGPLPVITSADEHRMVRESEQAAHQHTMRFAQPHRKRQRNNDNNNNNNGLARRRQRNIVPPRMDCWFCVASPSCESHLIVSIGEHMYLTAPKGALSPGHMLIVPVSHDSSMANISEAGCVEIQKYKDSLRQFYASHGEVPIFVERSITTKGPQHHTFIEAIPMPKDLASKLLPTSFSEESKYHNMEFVLMESNKSLYETAAEDRQYFHIEMPSRIQLIYNVPVDRKNKRLKSAADNGSGEQNRKRVGHRVPLQFARKIVCRVLSCPQRLHWKSCVVAPTVESQLANEFKTAFAKFDWTLADETSMMHSGSVGEEK